MCPFAWLHNITNRRGAGIRLAGIVQTVCLLVFFCTPRVALGDESVSDPYLLPMGVEARVDLASYVASTTLVCEGTACELHNEQSYQLYNKDKLHQHILRIASPQRPGERLQVSDVYVRDEEGNPLPPKEGETFQSAIWEIILAPNQRKSLSLSYVQPLSATHFMTWHPVVAPVEAWRSAGSVRLALELPDYAVQSILLGVEPSHYHFDGTNLEWEYEQLESLSEHKVMLYSPPTWQRLRALQKSNAHYELAQLYIGLGEAAGHQNVPYPDPFQKVVAELQAEIGASPQNTEARLDLATLYLERSDLSSDLNYLLLANHELAAILEYDPQNQQVADRLSRAYYRGAQRAQDIEDPEGALLYLEKAAQVPNTRRPYESEELENLRLRLALDLAEKGRVREALTQIHGTVASETEDALLHYAPPLIGVRTRVDLQPNVRTVGYEFQFYPPLAAEGRRRLQEVAKQFETLGDCQVILQPNQRQNVAFLEIRVPFRSIAGLEVWEDSVQKLLLTDEDLISAFVSQPWHADVRNYDVAVSPWGRRYRYGERVELSHTAALCEEEAQYASWRLIELRDDSAENETTRLRQSLAVIALSEQRQAWDQLASGSYWTYNVRYEDGYQSAASWLLSWGQTRDLEIDYYMYRWPRILGLCAALILLVFISSLATRRKHR